MSRVFGGEDGRQMRGAQPGQLGQRRLVETAFCHVRRIWFPANLPEFSTPAEVPSGVLTQDVSFLGIRASPWLVSLNADRLAFAWSVQWVARCDGSVQRSQTPATPRIDRIFVARA